MTAVVDGDHPARHGTEFHAGIDHNLVYVFDRESGERL
jgi:multiple sugar transport system ATP-binding protein